MPLTGAGCRVSICRSFCAGLAACLASATSPPTWPKRFSSSCSAHFPRFDRQREGSFRAWLRRVTVNKIRNYRRKRRRLPAVRLDPTDDFLERLSDPNDDLAREWDQDHDKHVVQKILAVVQPDFTPSTWQAFQRFGVDGVPARQVGKNWAFPRMRSFWPNRGS